MLSRCVFRVYQKKPTGYAGVAKKALVSSIKKYIQKNSYVLN